VNVPLYTSSELIIIIIIIIISVCYYPADMRSLIYIDTQVIGRLTNEQTISQALRGMPMNVHLDNNNYVAAVVVLAAAIQYNTIQDAVLTWALKPTRVSLIYRYVAMPAMPIVSIVARAVHLSGMVAVGQALSER